MKAIIPILVLTLALLACGCTTTAPAAPVQITTPTLTGIWTGPMQGYDETTGFTDYPALSIALNITEQHGRIFSGNVLFT